MNYSRLFLSLLLGFAGIARSDLDLVTVENGTISVVGGGPHGTWAQKKAAIELSTKAMEKGSAMVLAYDVGESNQACGVWFAVPHFDLRSYDAVEFEVRGAKGGEMLAFGFKDERWFEQLVPLQDYIPSGMTTNWAKVTIPLKAFSTLRQPYSLDNCTLSFTQGSSGAPKGEIYVTSIRLTGNRLMTLPPPDEPHTGYPLTFDPATASDAQIEEVLQHSGFEYFWKESVSETGLVKDACYAYGEDAMPMASIASVGFGLSYICVAEKHQWITHDEAYGRTLNIMRFFHDKAENHKGFFYHFYDLRTGERSGDCELSSIDTGLLLYGMITAKEFYPGTEVSTLAQDILDRVEWNWMQLPNGLISMGWSPEKPVLMSACWGGYDEGVMLYPLAIGSKTHPILPKSWDSVRRDVITYKGHRHVAGSGKNALFTHQYPQVWLDLRNYRDKKGINYFQNSVEATLANRDWCIDHRNQFKTFHAGYWGLTASYGPNGYNVNGAPNSLSNGTVAPTAALGSYVFTPKLSMESARNFFKLKDQLWGKYGFVDGFNLDKNWYSNRYVGIDQGPIVLMIENEQSGLIWDLTMHDASIQTGLERMGFVKMEKTAKAEN